MITEIAPTLADLKRLPLADQGQLLLARLAVIYPQTQSAGGLHKGNLLLADDPFGLAAGYADAENSEVRRHLLGAPWTALVNQGYLIDPAGNGFYSVPEEGFAALNHASDDVNARPPADIPANLEALPNKQSLMKMLAMQIQSGNLISVLFVDLDNFKQVNDRHGHSEGDKCLLDVAAQMSRAISGKGRLYRLGGDEFCIVLPNFSISEAASTAERVRQTVDALTLFCETTKVTTSIGVACSHPQGLPQPLRIPLEHNRRVRCPRGDCVHGWMWRRDRRWNWRRWQLGNACGKLRGRNGNSHDQRHRAVNQQFERECSIGVSILFGITKTPVL